MISQNHDTFFISLYGLHVNAELSLTLMPHSPTLEMSSAGSFIGNNEENPTLIARSSDLVKDMVRSIESVIGSHDYPHGWMDTVVLPHIVKLRSLDEKPHGGLDREHLPSLP